MVGAVRFSSRSRALTALLPPVLDCSPILSSFQVILLEHIIMCRLVTGHKATALQEVRPPGPRARGGWVSGVAVREDVHLPSAHRQDILPCHFTVPWLFRTLDGHR